MKQPQVLVTGKPAVSRLRTTVPAIGDQTLLPALEKAGVEVGVDPTEGSGFGQLLIGLLPILVIIAVLSVPGLSAPALEFGPDLSRSAGALVAGFPRNGPFTAGAARVRDRWG